VTTLDSRVTTPVGSLAASREPRPSPPTTLIEVAGPSRPTKRVLLPRWLRKLYGPVALLLLWWSTSATGLLDPDLFPPPGAVVGATTDLIADGELFLHVWASIQRVLYGLLFGVLGGTVLAVLSGLTRIGEDLLDSTMQILKAVPNYALTPLLIMWMGIGEEPKILLIALGVGIAIYINTYSAIRGVDNALVEAATTLGASRAALIWHVILPGSLPGFLVGLRLALSGAWLSLIFAETINTTEGIGYLMTRAQNLLQSEVSVLILVIYAVIGMISYAFVRFLERRLLAWRPGFQGT